jgi:hypothetical protein
VEIDREEDQVTILLSARYRPENEENHETDQWGYTETSMLPILQYTESDTELANLIEAFVPLAVKKAGGFGEFRETATKTLSLVDRLEELTLPELDDVQDEFKEYQQAVSESKRLDSEIEDLEQRINHAIYELYGLTDDEIGVIEEVAGI